MSENLRRKVCTRCELNLPEDEFSRRKKSRDGLQSTCKTCQSVLRHEYYTRNRERCIAYAERWIADHADEFREINLAYMRRKNAGIPSRDPRYLAEIPK